MNSAQYRFHLQLLMNINRNHQIRVLVDSEATDNYISENFANRTDVSRQDKEVEYELKLFNSNLNQIKKEIKLLLMTAQQHHKTIIFDIVEMVTHDVVLEISWLKQHNSIINWKKEVLKFEKCEHIIIFDSVHSQCWTTDKKSYKELAATSIKNNLKKQDSVSVDTQLDQQNQQIRNQKRGDKPLDIFKKYKQWEYLFQKETTAKVLFKHQFWDHKIVLLSEKQSIFESIYQLSEKKLRILKDYLDKNLQKGFIRSSKLSAEYSILFALKKDRIMQLCVNYWKLNNITVKDRYLLPSIIELQNRLSNAKHFTKLDLQRAYNLIWMKKEEKWKTAFCTQYKLYKYLIMLFELINALTIC